MLITGATGLLVSVISSTEVIKVATICSSMALFTGVGVVISKKKSVCEDQVISDNLEILNLAVYLLGSAFICYGVGKEFMDLLDMVLTVFNLI